MVSNYDILIGNKGRRTAQGKALRRIMAGKPYIKAVRYAKHFPVKGVIARDIKGEWCRNVLCGTWW